MSSNACPFAIAIGASTGIGCELARQCIQNGYDVLIAATEPEIEPAVRSLGQNGAGVEAGQADLSGLDGVDKLYAAARVRKVGALLANAGRGLGRAFLERDPTDWRHVVDTNVTGTLLLIQKVGRDMRDAGAGRILITGSIASSFLALIRRSTTGRRRSSIVSPSLSGTN